ncbi:MAG: lysophospholipid acyltransferase family protein [Candidatus Didemnitutus sp.]|nr:lysophospholipid acyltransferase family protein [Candidatus Didemnitutus sp.]
MPRTPDNLAMTRYYGFFHYWVIVIHQAFFRGEVAGTDNIPEHGPFLIAANHASHLDPPLVGGYVGRQMRFFARKTLWSNPVAAGWFDGLECIPVDRDSGDIGAIRRVLQALHENRAVVLFPEGTRSPDGKFQSPKAGVGLVACKTGVPVVPCRVYGSFEAFGRSNKIPNLGAPITLVFGQPIPASDYDVPGAGKERYQIASERIFERIAALPEPRFAVI